MASELRSKQGTKTVETQRVMETRVDMTFNVKINH